MTYALNCINLFTLGRVNIQVMWYEFLTCCITCSRYALLFHTWRKGVTFRECARWIWKVIVTLPGFDSLITRMFVSMSHMTSSIKLHSRLPPPNPNICSHPHNIFHPSYEDCCIFRMCFHALVQWRMSPKCISIWWDEWSKMKFKSPCCLHIYLMKWVELDIEWQHALDCFFFTEILRLPEAHAPFWRL